MANYYTTSGLARSTQLVDVTGQSIAESNLFGTGASMSSSLFTLDVYGNQIPIETIRDRLASIREKSHSELGEAWSKLAQM